MTDLRADLQADLLADLAPDEPLAQEVLDPVALPGELAEATPAVSVTWTPLRWSRPRVVRASQGTGKALRVGPFTVEVAVRDS